MHKRKNPDLVAWQRQSPANAVFWWGENERRAKQMVEDMFLDIPLDKKLLFLRLVRFEFGRAVRLGLLPEHLLRWVNNQCDLMARKQKAKKASKKQQPVSMWIRISKEMHDWLEAQPQDSIAMAVSHAVERYYRESGKNTPRCAGSRYFGNGYVDTYAYVDARIKRVSGNKSGAVRKMIEWCMERDA